MRVLDAAHACLLYLLNRSVWENALLFSIWVEALYCAIWEADFFRPVREVFLDLIVLEFEDLNTVGEGGLRRLRVREEVDDLASLEALLDVIVLEEDYLVAIRPDFPLDTVGEDYLFLARVIDPLDFSFGTYEFFDQLLILLDFIGVVLLWEDEVILVRSLRY